MVNQIFKGNTNDFEEFARAGVVDGNYNERQLKYYNYVNGFTFRSLPAAIKASQKSKAAEVFQLFSNGEQGVWYDPSDLSTLFQDSAGTTPVTADGDPVGLMLDKSGNGNHASQATSASRPVYRTDGTLHWLKFDGVDDYLDSTGLVSFQGQFFISSAYTIAGSTSNAGPWRFLRDGGSPTNTTSNLLEEYVGPAPSFEFKTLAQRYPASNLLYQESANPPPEDVRVSWVSNGSTMKQQVIPSQGAITDEGEKSVSSGQATLSIARGYAGNLINGQWFGFVWLSRAPTDAERDSTNQYLIQRSGVIV